MPNAEVIIFLALKLYWTLLSLPSPSTYSSTELEFSPMNFTGLNEILLDVKATSCSKSHRNYVIAIETLLSSNDKSFSDSDFSSTSSFCSKISIMECLFVTFDFDLCICRRSSLTIHIRQPAINTFTAARSQRWNLGTPDKPNISILNFNLYLPEFTGNF